MTELQPLVVHADDWIVVVDKPGGLLAVPGRGPDKQDCVVRRVRAEFSPCLEQPAVHRLDQATSGLMVLARDAASHRRLSRQFARRRVEKKYIALLQGVVREPEGEIRLRFRLDPDNRPRQVYDNRQGKLGVTLWRRSGSHGPFVSDRFFLMQVLLRKEAIVAFLKPDNKSLSLFLPASQRRTTHS